LANYEPAARYYKRALDIDPENPVALYGLANCSRGQKDHAEGSLWWAKALEKDPDNQRLNTRAGDALFNTETSRKLSSISSAACVSASTLCTTRPCQNSRSRNQIEDAQTCCQQVLDRIPDHPRALEELAKIRDTPGSER